MTKRLKKAYLAMAIASTYSKSALEDFAEVYSRKDLFNDNQSYQKMNKGKLSKKQRRKL